MTSAEGVNITRSRHLRRDGIEGSEGAHLSADLPAPSADPLQAYLTGTAGTPVSAPFTVPCARCGHERAYAPDGAPERRRWLFWLRPDDRARCRVCGAV